MDALDLSYFLIAAQPFGGILVSIPLGYFSLDYPLWFLFVSSPPLAYVQVVVVDLLWTQLERWPRLRAFLDRRRSPRVERLLASRGAFWPTFTLTPLVGPWVIMAFMRYARIPQRRIALPILLSLTTVTVAVLAACTLVPHWFGP